jgi:hypothetical protein
MLVSSHAPHTSAYQSISNATITPCTRSHEYCATRPAQPLLCSPLTTAKPHPYARGSTLACPPHARPCSHVPTRPHIPMPFRPRARAPARPHGRFARLLTHAGLAVTCHAFTARAAMSTYVCYLADQPHRVSRCSPCVSHLPPRQCLSLHTAHAQNAHAVIYRSKRPSATSR